jgi:chemotaxis protein MotB
VRKRREKFDSHENLERWLLTYADLITLLLAFFVVMYSMSKVDAKKFGKMAEALNGVLKGGESVMKNPSDAKKTGHGLLQIGNLKTIQKQVEERFKEINRQGEIKTEVTERGLVVHIMESALFKAASATLEPRAMEILDLIAAKVKGIPNHVRIEGHTDDRPISTSVFPSNWELSSARATAVVRYFTNNHGITPDRVSALGYGEYRPIKPNNNIENRAQNRRVDIVILTMEMTDKEPTSQLYYITRTTPDSLEKDSTVAGLSFPELPPDSLSPH